MHDGINEYTLLCEDCGYVIEGMAQEDRCPECGTRVVESLPERRSLIPGKRDIIRHPFRSFDRVTIEDPDSAGRRTAVRCLIAGSLVAGAFVIGWLPWWFVEMDLPRAVYSALIATLTAVFASALLWVVLLLLTWIEMRGLRFIGARHGYRTTKAVAETVCSHASVGWVIGGAIWFLGWIAVGAGVLVDFFVPLGLLIGVVGLIAGLLIFEGLAYIGMRRCKFANRARPESAEAMQE